MNQEDEEFNRIERESKLRMDLIRDVKNRNKAMDREYVRPWVGLTADEQAYIYTKWDEDKGWGPLVEAIEQALKEKNT